MSLAPICPVCDSAARLTSGAEIYPHRPDLAKNPIWCCPVCPQTYVGCHPETTDALGTPAGPALRRARMDVHAVLDRLWRKPKGPMPRGGHHLVPRKTAYAYLSWALGLDGHEAHVGLFDLARCAAAIEALKSVSVETLRGWTPPPHQPFIAPDPRPPMPIEFEHKFLMRDPATLFRTLIVQVPAQILEQCYVRGRATFTPAGVNPPRVVLEADDPAASPAITLPVSAADHALALRVAGADTDGVPGEIRFRAVTGDGAHAHFVTFKMPVGDDLLEIEAPIAAETFGGVISDDRVRKTRFSLPGQPGQWDIDFIHAPESDAIALSLIELEGASSDGYAVHPLLEGHLGARIPREDQLLFTNRRFCDPGYAASIVERYVYGALQREGLANAVPGVTVFHTKFDRADALNQAVCGGPDAEIVAAVHAAIAANEFRAVARFSTDSLEEALAMTTHGQLWPTEGWHNRPEPARYRFGSPLGRTKEAASDPGALFVHAGQGYVLAYGPIRYGQVEGHRFIAVGPVDAEAVRAAYPWP